MEAHSTVVVVPVGEAAQFPFIDPSTVKAGHPTGCEWNKFELIEICTLLVQWGKTGHGNFRLFP